MTAIALLHELTGIVTAASPILVPVVTAWATYWFSSRKDDPDDRPRPRGRRPRARRLPT